MKGLKWVATLQATFEKQNNENEIITRHTFFNSKADTVLNENDFRIIQSTNQILNKVGNWIKQGSGWIIKSLNKHYFNVTQYSPLNAGSYIELLEELRNARKGLINIKNLDNKCSLYCHLTKLNEDKVKSHPEKVSNYKKYVVTVNYDGIEFPVSVKQVPKIEDQNNRSINVFGYENKIKFPLYISKKWLKQLLMFY